MPNHIHMIAAVENKGWVKSGHWGGAPTVHPADQFPGRLARSFMAGSVRIIYESVDL